MQRGRYASRIRKGRATMWRRKARRRWLGRRAKKPPGRRLHTARWWVSRR